MDNALVPYLGGKLEKKALDGTKTQILRFASAATD
jgi:hypothetical protein